VASNRTIQRAINLTERDALNLQIASLQASCQVATKQNATTTSLATVTYMFDLLPKCREMNLVDVEGPIHEAVSDVLWSHGEQTAAINILRSLSFHQKPNSPTKHQKAATMLAKLVSCELILKTNTNWTGTLHRRSQTGKYRRNNTQLP
jgi:ataxia telangiectasia mutated family protein